MLKTANYNLNKPEYSESADIAALNENADLIDAALADKVDKETGKGLVSDSEKEAWDAKETPAGVQVYVGDKDELLTDDKSTLVAAVNELFTDVSNGKDLIASAITDKGVPASGSDTFPALAGKIEDIPVGGGGEYGTATPAEVLDGYTIGTEEGVLPGTLALTGSATAPDVDAGKTFYNTNAKTKITGTKVNRAGDNACLASSVSGTTLKLRAPAGSYDGVDDNVTITDADFVEANIANGINLFGKAGTLVGAPSHGSQAFTSGGTFTVPTGVTLIFILCVGGGGGGGRGWDTSYPGGGGASGYYGIKIVAVTPGTQYAVTVGAAGAGASYPSGYPGQGGASSVGSLISVGGGVGGGNGSNDGTGGYGGVDAYPAASGATYGNNSFGGAANTTGHRPANRGANSLTGTGGAYRTSAGPGNAASGYGAGGGGAFASYAGGPGSQGLVYIWW